MQAGTVPLAVVPPKVIFRGFILSQWCYLSFLASPPSSDVALLLHFLHDTWSLISEQGSPGESCSGKHTGPNSV